MSRFPWSSDRDLSDELARHLIESQFPQLAPARVTHRAQGWDNEALEINGEWIFRCPKRADSAAYVERELRLLPQIATRLPLPIPRYEFFGRPTAEFPYLFAVYRKLPGTPATHVSDIDEVTIAAQLGAFLSALHAIPLGAVEQCGVEAAEDDPRDYLPGALKELQAVAPHLPTGTGAACRAFLERQLPAFESIERRCLLHDDLRDEHILLAPDGSRVVGVIDWTDAAWGDAARDFAGLWAWRGEDFARRASEHHEHSTGADFWPRVRFYGICCIISTLDYALKIGDERTASFERGALLRALGETESA